MPTNEYTRTCSREYCKEPALAYGKRLCRGHLAQSKARSAATHASGLPERQRAAALAENRRRDPAVLADNIQLTHDQMFALLERIEQLENRVISLECGGKL